MMNIDTIIGIDPGAQGGIAVWQAGAKVKTMRMPRDISELREYMTYLVENFRPVVFLEKLSVRPDDVTVEGGSANLGKLYRIQKMIAQYEQLKATLDFCGVPFVQVHPMKWQNGLHLRIKGEEKAARKRRFRDIAGEIYPEVDATLWNADAVLIMHFGRHILKDDPNWVLENLPRSISGSLFE